MNARKKNRQEPSHGMPCFEALEPRLLLAASIIGTPADDMIIGSDSGDKIVCHAGDDMAFGEIGDDTIGGCEGDDILYGGPG